MMRWVLLAVLVVAITVSATLLVEYLPTGSSSPGELPYPAASRTGPQPLAVVEGDTTYHFGLAAQQAEIKKEWVIRNEGKADLVLTKGPPACSCTVADFENGKDTITLKPGEQTTHHLTFHTNDIDGVYRKSATVDTNDPLHPVLEFVGEGTVRPSVVLYPPEPTINFLDVSNDKDDHRAGVALYSPDRPEIKITELISSRPDHVTVDSEPMTAEDCKKIQIQHGHRINIHLSPSMPLGSFREEVIVKTDHPKRPEVRLTVTGRMVGPISASPERLRMIPVLSRTGKTADLKLTVRGLRPTRFEVERKPAKFQVEITPADQSQHAGQYRMTVTVPPGMPPGQIVDEIVLKTDHPKAGEVKIPVDIVIEKEEP